MAQKKTSLGEIIRDYRKKNKISVKKFSECSGLSQSYIAILEKNERPDTHRPPTPSLECVVAAAKTMSMDTFILLQRIGLSLDDQECKSQAHPALQSSKRNFYSEIKPINLVEPTEENIARAKEENRLLVLPFPLPIKDQVVWIPIQKYGMSVAHFITNIEGGVFTAYSESCGYIKFGIYDIGSSVFLTRRDAGPAVKKMRSY